MIRSLQKLLLALMIVPLFASRAVSLEPVDLPLTDQTRLQQLRGVWEGSWYWEGYDNTFRLTIWDVTEEGRIMGERMYVSPNSRSSYVPTEGRITDNQLNLDENRDQDRWIKLKLYKDPETGKLWLNGQYSFVGGITTYLGNLRTKKVSSVVDDITKEEFKKILVADEEWVGKWSFRNSDKTGTYELLLLDNLSIGATWWDGSTNTAMNIRIGNGTLTYDISGRNRTYRFRYVKDGESYKLVGTLSGLTKDLSQTFVNDIVLKPKK